MRTGGGTNNSHKAMQCNGRPFSLYFIKGGQGDGCVPIDPQRLEHSGNPDGPSQTTSVVWVDSPNDMQYGGATTLTTLPDDELERMMEDLQKQMKAAAQELAFERAAQLRDQLNDLRIVLEARDTRPEWEKIRSQESNEPKPKRKGRVKYDVSKR
jgi:hypothetical protein